MKQIKLVLSKNAQEVYSFLNKESKDSKIEESILKALHKKIDLIKENPHYGQPIEKKLIPKEYIKNYELKNLFRVELPSFWRMLYTLTNNENEIEIIAFVLDICDHKKYNKLFKYKKR